MYDYVKWLLAKLGGGGGLVAKSYPTVATPWTVARQASLPMGFSRQEYWSGLPFPSPGDLPDPGIEPRSPALQAYSLLTELQGKLTVADNFIILIYICVCVYVCVCVCVCIIIILYTLDWYSVIWQL